MNDVIPLLKFTPSAQSAEVLEAITVQREPLIAALVEGTLDQGGDARHQLLVGPRGIGKTHIMSVLASRIRVEARADIVVAWLDEDPWAIRSYGKFVASIAARVAAETGDAELAKAASDLRAAGDEGPAAEDLLRRALGDRRLVLLVENLDDIFRRIKDEGQARFRAFAEDWRQLVIVATTPQLFAGVRRQTSPFYGFFAVTHLEELRLENAVELLKRIARLREDDELVDFLSTDLAMSRLVAVQALAGGHPRIWLLLAGCISVPAIEELVPLFLEALDDLTPYYQDRLRMLGDQQQEIVVLLSEAGGALSNRELADRSGVTQNQVATMLSLLADRGYVRHAELPEGLATGDRRMTFWELREPLMRLCLDVKQARGEPLRIVVEFLRAWYGPRLLDELLRLPQSARLAATYAAEAFRTLDAPAIQRSILHDSPSEMVKRAERGLTLLPENTNLQFAKGTGLLLDGHPAEALEAFTKLVPSTPPGKANAALQFQMAACQRALDQPLSEETLATMEEAHDLDPDDPDAAVLLAQTYELFGRTEEAANAWRQAIALDPDDANLHSYLGSTLKRLDRTEEAVEAYGSAAALDPERADVRRTRGQLLIGMGQHAEALEVLAEAVQLAPDEPTAYAYQGLALVHLGRGEEALETSQKALELRPDTAPFHNLTGLALMILKRYEEALAAFTRAVELDPDHHDYHDSRGWVLTRLDRREEAVAAYERAAELNPGDPAQHNSLANTLRSVGRFDDARRAAERAIEIDGSDPVYRFTLAEIALTQNDHERALVGFRAAFEVWSDERKTPPGDPNLICELLWETPDTDNRRRALIAGVAGLYEEFDVLDSLGSALVGTVSLFVDDHVSEAAATNWLDEWTAATSPTELEIPLSILRAALRWKVDHDRAHLLSLPAEQREILVQILMPGEQQLESDVDA